ncbi:MAG TPA: hypothetical protein VJR02_19780 [Pyrinomonadaceae bacterium]|nr:hypothetical protein [Pyrinomonadaceae bacterium]
MPEDSSHALRQYLLAKHLEVFVPKSQASEGRLRLWLNNLMLMPAVPMHKQNQVRADLLQQIEPEVATKLSGKEYWENIVYGYSIYETDGHFLSYGRSIRGYFTEQTLIIKFILTNYVTKNVEQLIRLDTPAPIRRAILPAWDVKISKLSGMADYAELCCTILHYNDISDFIVTEITENVLQNEQEVWAHGWNTILDRRAKTAGSNTSTTTSSPDSRDFPIILNQSEKKARFGEKADCVLCVIDYSAKAPQVGNG